MKRLKYILFCLLSALALNMQGQEAARLIVLTDIENEPDDAESMVRLLLYSNEIDIRGIVATTSTHMRHRIWPESIHRAIDAYAKVYGNLLLHDKRYPSAKSLHERVKTGQPHFGMACVGEGKSTDGSRLIVEQLKGSERPLWISVWGGVNTLAQALFDLRSECADRAQLDEYVSRLRVYTIGDQDESGPWLRREFPSLFYIVSPGSYPTSTWAGINTGIPDHDELNEVVSNEWIAANIQQGHGPMGAVYPDVAYGMEGDTPSFLGLIANGLNVPDHPDYGGWGGRYELYIPDSARIDPTGPGAFFVSQETRPIWTNAVDTWYPVKSSRHGCPIVKEQTPIIGNQATIWRWRTAIQNDFAARMDWTVKSFAEANHAPVAVLTHPDTLTVKAGERFQLEAQESYDPDGDNLSFYWYDYPEVGTYGKEVKRGGALNLAHVSIAAPEVKEPVTLHYILEVTDKGTPRLTTYRRVIVTVKPQTRN